MSNMLLSLVVLVCLHAAIVTGTGEVRLGEDPRRRSYVDSARHLLMVPDLDTGSTVNGEVRGFEFHARNTNQVQISVWRRESGEHFRYVGGVNFTPAHSGRNNVALTQSQYISIEVGDILGLSWRSGGVIDFDTTGCQHRPNTRVVWGPGHYTPGQMVTLNRSGNSSWGPCRRYSVRAVIQEWVPCVSGTFSSSGNQPCDSCATGSYASGSGATQCQGCGAGQTTAGTGSTSAEDCYAPASGVLDPHFMITDSATKEHLCFDYAGRPEEVMPLIADPRSGIFVDGKLFAPDPEIEGVTYFADIEVKSRTSIVLFTRTGISVNGQEYSWSSEETHVSEDVVLRPVTERLETIMIELEGGEVSLVVNRHEGDVAGQYLGIYVAHVDGLSEETQGVIGQFVHSNFHISEENNRHFATVSLFRGDVTVPVSSELRFSPTAHGKLSCWLYNPYHENKLLTIDNEHNDLVFGAN